MEKQIHGGNIYDKEVSLDFSVNINPLGMPDGVQDAILNNMSGYETYPDIRYTALREAVAGKERVQAERILCGNGASELIMAVVRAVRPYKCAVAAPSFSGYERAVSAYGAETEYYKLDERMDLVMQMHAVSLRIWISRCVLYVIPIILQENLYLKIFLLIYLIYAGTGTL